MRSKSSSPVKKRIDAATCLWVKAYGAVALLSFAAMGCAPNIHQSYRHLRPQLAAHQDSRALAYLTSVEDSVYGSNNALLFLMDRAMVQFDGQDTPGCIATLERAKGLSEKLQGRHTGNEIAAWFTSDNALPYQGEDFENVFLHVLEALSYARVGNLSDARVETRQASSHLRRLAQRLQGKPVTYQDDAFAHFFSGLLFEADTTDLSHNSDARIEYQKALELYEQVDGPTYRVPVPRQLVAALTRVLQRLGPEAAQDLTGLGTKYGSQQGFAVRAKATTPPAAKVVIVALVGEAPYKGEAAWEVLLGPNIYRVVYPRFIAHTKRPPPLVTLAQSIAWGEMVMDVQAIAQRNLSDHMDRIKNRVLAREVTKYTAGTVAEGVGLEHGGLVGLGTFLAGFALNTVTAATTRADTRSWATLPEAVYLYTAEVMPGPITLQVGALPPQTLTLAPGEHRFVAVRTLAD